MKVLGIETSCDETSASVVTGDKEILSNIIFSQVEEHQPYGGVVPEIASRSHINHISNIVKQAMTEANTTYDELEAIAVTSGPGLIGGVIVGLMTAKGIAAASGKNLISINHLEGHALTARLTENIEFPYLMLLVSGGHCQILAVEDVGKYKKYGATIDDAAGESFDKVAKMLGLDYPGGPIVEKLALSGDEDRFKFPKPLCNRAGCDFSFSGLKTAVFREIQKETNRDEQFKRDICASFQKTCGDIFDNRLKNAFKEYLNDNDGKRLIVAGGVAANKYLIGRIRNIGSEHGFETFSAPMELCTDNAAMIAWAGIEKIKAGHKPDNFDIKPQARWAL